MCVALLLLVCVEVFVTIVMCSALCVFKQGSSHGHSKEQLWKGFLLAYRANPVCLQTIASFNSGISLSWHGIPGHLSMPLSASMIQRVLISNTYMGHLCRIISLLKMLFPWFEMLSYSITVVILRPLSNATCLQIPRAQGASFGDMNRSPMMSTASRIYLMF